MSWILIGNCVIKRNGVIRSVPVPISAEVTNDDPNKVAITFDQALLDTSLPATTAFALVGKTISNVAIVGAVVTLTVTVTYDYGDLVTVDYIEPALNPLAAVVGGAKVVSFAAQTVTNNIAYPIILEDGNTVAFYDYTIGVTQSGNRISKWEDRLGSGHDLLMATANHQPTLMSTGVYFPGQQYIYDNSAVLKTIAFTLNQPVFYYIVCKQTEWNAGRYIFDGNGADSGLLFQNLTTPKLRAYAGSLSGENANLSVDTWGIIRVCFNGASSKLQINETAAITGNFGASNPGGFTLASSGALGNQTPCKMEVKEVIIRKVADDSPDESIIYNYLKNKYSL